MRVAAVGEQAFLRAKKSEWLWIAFSNVKLTKKKPERQQTGQIVRAIVNFETRIWKLGYGNFREKISATGFIFDMSKEPTFARFFFKAI